ncbi:MAG: nodulation protein NfeD, partial [Pseudomonadota bacterium]
MTAVSGSLALPLHPGANPRQPMSRNMNAVPRIFGLLCFALTVAVASPLGSAAQAVGPRGTAFVADVEGAIGPAARKHVADAIAEASDRSAELLVLRINTPGGLVSSTREIVSDILAAPVPVIGFVAPAGGHAASAGFYILYATHVAAMAPGTNTGAATPVQIGLPAPPTTPRPLEAPEDSGGDNGVPAGEDADATEPATPPPDPMSAKALSDAVAFLRSLAELRGRNADWAERAVREGVSLAAHEALQEGVVEIVADDVKDLIAQLDGRVVTAAGLERRLETDGLVIERIEPSVVTDVLRFLSDPNVALILMMIGVYGLILEFSNPGIGPGIVGAISLLLGLYALNQLPIDYTGLGLIMFGVVLMVVEALTPAFGVLGIGGIAAFTIGALMLIDTDVPAYQVSVLTIVLMAALSFAVLSLLLRFVWRAHRRAVRTGRAEMVGSEVQVLEWQDGSGRIWTHGEAWRAVGPRDLTPGMTAR